MRRNRQRDPLAPVEFVATFLLAVNTFLIVLSLAFVVLDENHSFLGENDVCVNVSNSSPAAMFFAEEHPTPGTDVEPGSAVPDGVSIDASRFSVCATSVPERIWSRLTGVHGPAPHPSTEQRWWNRLVVWPPAFYGMGALTFVWLLARRARRDGFFVDSVARGLRRLGTYLAVGSVMTSVVVLLARKQLLDTLLPKGVGYWDIGIDLSWTTVFVGVGLVTLGRVMGHAVAMREELDATV